MDPTGDSPRAKPFTSKVSSSVDGQNEAIGPADWPLSKEDAQENGEEEPADLSELWNVLAKAPDEEAARTEAKKVAMELKQYLIAPRRNQREDQDAENKDSEEEESSNDSRSKKKQKDVSEQILFKIGYEAAGKRKRVGNVTAERLVEILIEAFCNIKRFVNHHEWESAICDVMTKELVPALLAVLLESKEHHLEGLNSSTFNILEFLMRRARAWEAHVLIKVTIGRGKNEQFLAYLMHGELLRLWHKIMPRILWKRKNALVDAYHLLEHVPSFRSQKESKDEICKGGTAAPDFESQLIELVDLVRCAQEGQEGPVFADDPDKEAEFVKDLVVEKEILVALLLRAVSYLVDLFPERDENVKLSAKRKTALKKSRKPFVVQIERAMALLRYYGLRDPLTALQKASRLLDWRFLLAEDGAVMQEDKPVLSVWSINNFLPIWSADAFSNYLCVCLGMFRESVGIDGDPSKMIPLRQTSISLLHPVYALCLGLPYCLILCSKMNSVYSWRGAMLSRIFLENVPDRYWKDRDIALRTRYGERISGYSVCLTGLTRALADSAGTIQDNKRRRSMYETVQVLISKFPVGALRFRLVRTLFLGSTKVAMVGQLVTQLKDALHDCEVDSAADPKVVDGLRWDFVHTLLPHVLTPRREMLAALTAIVSVCNGIFYVVVRDTESMKKDNVLVDSIKERVEYVRTYIKLAKEALRSMAAVAEHDRTTTPKRVKKPGGPQEQQARALYDAAGKTINDCVVAIAALDRAMERLQGV